MQRSVSNIRNNERKERAMNKFDTSAPISAAIDIPAGRIQVIAADRSDTTVEILPADASSSRDARAAEQTTVEYGDGVLRIQAPAKRTVLGSSGSIEVTVQLPAGSRVEAKAASAEFRSVGRLGDVAFEGSQASIKLDEAASARLTTLDGDITLGRLGGDAQITTARGDIHITHATRGTLTLRTEAGSISVDAAAGASASLDAGTTHGRIRNALNNTGTTDLNIQATTAYGDITARSL
jgi:Putative adhesin